MPSDHITTAGDRVRPTRIVASPAALLARIGGRIRHVVVEHDERPAPDPVIRVERPREIVVHGNGCVLPVGADIGTQWGRAVVLSPADAYGYVRLLLKEPPAEEKKSHGDATK